MTSNLLETLVLYDNTMTGGIPDDIGKLTALRTFDINTNAITGTIPTTLGTMTSLQTLSLFRNDLNGPIPDTIMGLQQLINLDAHGNTLSGTIPAGVDNLPNLGKENVDILFIVMYSSCLPIFHSHNSQSTITKQQADRNSSCILCCD
jgi:Leucine-rich repeat (LRR) protein